MIRAMQPDREAWRPVGHDWPYEISNMGRVRRTLPACGTVAGRLVRPFPRSGTVPYLCVNLYRNRRARPHAVHQLVAAAFIGPVPDGYQVNHRDGNKVNNHISNLEYVTPSENSRHAFRIGLRRVIGGSRHASAKLTDTQVSEIRTRYGGGGVTQRALASEYGVGQSRINRIVQGKAYVCYV